MTNDELKECLIHLETHMTEIAKAMACKPYPLSYHAMQLYGAAGMVRDWAINIEREGRE
jgi:hypothetical protein